VTLLLLVPVWKINSYIIMPKLTLTLVSVPFRIPDPGFVQSVLYAGIVWPIALLIFMVRVAVKS